MRVDITRSFCVFFGGPQNDLTPRKVQLEVVVGLTSQLVPATHAEATVSDFLLHFVSIIDKCI